MIEESGDDDAVIWELLRIRCTRMMMIPHDCMGSLPWAFIIASNQLNLAVHSFFFNCKYAFGSYS